MNVLDVLEQKPDSPTQPVTPPAGDILPYYAFFSIALARVLSSKAMSAFLHLPPLTI